MTDSATAFGVRVLDLHLAVVAVQRKPDGGFEVPKPIIYGTAFPVLPGLLVTAGHVADHAHTDGMIGLVRIGPDGQIKVSAVRDCEVFSSIDVALLDCPGLNELVPLPIDFDHQLGMLDPAYAIGLSSALDPEWVTLVPRAFRGHVVTRREMYQLRAQPPGYELSFHAPQGLSGAPLVSHIRGSQCCYGYMIQQATIGSGQHETVVGIAIDISVLLSLRTQVQDRGVLAEAFGRLPVELPTPSPVQLPGGRRIPVIDPSDWPDDAAIPAEQTGDQR